MSKKRAKFDKLQRQADHLEKKAETRPEQTPKKGEARGVSQAAGPNVRETTER